MIEHGYVGVSVQTLWIFLAIETFDALIGSPTVLLHTI